jgi:transcriptional/translational regulatory protein YebC/TACO1
MAGHNKGSKAKRRKGALDRKPGKLLGRLALEITLAAITRGGSPGTIAPLRWRIAGVHWLIGGPEARADADVPERKLTTLELALFQFKQNAGLAVSFDATDEHRVRQAAPHMNAEKVTNDVETHLTITPRDQLRVGGDSLMKGRPRRRLRRLHSARSAELPRAFTNKAAAAQVLRFCEALQEDDDIHTVHAKVDNFETLLVKLGA